MQEVDLGARETSPGFSSVGDTLLCHAKGLPPQE